MAAFLAKRDGLAAGQGLPTGVAQSASATRQWVSDELTESARTVAERSREAGDAWLHRVWQRTLAVVWGSVAVLVIGEAVTAIGAGWSTARTAGLLAGCRHRGTADRRRPLPSGPRRRPGPAGR